MNTIKCSWIWLFPGLCVAAPFLAVKLSDIRGTINLLLKVNAPSATVPQVCAACQFLCLPQLPTSLSHPQEPRSTGMGAGHRWQRKSESRLCSVCVGVCVRVCGGLGCCCHFGNATAHIAAITTAEKCFSATCNYYRLQIAVLASEALAREGETLSVSVCVCVCVCMCVSVKEQRQTDKTDRDKEGGEMIITHTKNLNSKMDGMMHLVKSQHENG